MEETNPRFVFPCLVLYRECFVCFVNNEMPRKNFCVSTSPSCAPSTEFYTALTIRPHFRWQLLVTTRTCIYLFVVIVAHLVFGSRFWRRRMQPLQISFLLEVFLLKILLKRHITIFMVSFHDPEQLVRAGQNIVFVRLAPTSTEAMVTIDIIVRCQ